MVPARNRERKCSTCKHYQASPLWRKGWCRNPLLYDRNTNHLVEADTLACNRTFIDYWEPLDTSRLAKNGHDGEQTTKPRIAPSVPLEQVDRKGNRRMVGENTPATGMPVARNSGASKSKAEVPPKQVLTLDATRRRSPLAAFTEDDDLLDEDMQWPADPNATQQIEEIEGPDSLQHPATTRQPASRTRKKPRATRTASVLSRPLPFVRVPLWIALMLLAVIAIGAGSYLLLLRPRLGTNTPIVAAGPSVTVPAATATGFGDPTATAPPQPTTQASAVATPQLPPPDTIGVNGYVQVSSASGLVVRSDPTTSGKRITVLPNGTKARVIEGPQEANGYTWWKITGFNPQDPELAGWCAQTFLKPTTAP